MNICMYSSNNFHLRNMGRRRHLLLASAAVAAIGYAQSVNADPTPINGTKEISNAFGEATVNIINAGKNALIVDASGTVTIVSGTISTIGDRNKALMARNGGKATVTPGENATVTFTTSGYAAHAVQAGGNGTNKDAYPTGSAGTVSMTGGTIRTTGEYGTGLHAVDQGTITAENVSIQNSGVKGHGAHVESESYIYINNSIINVTGTNAHGIHANNDQNKYPGFEDARGGYAELVNTSITTTSGYGLDVSAGATVQATGGSITTSGAKAYGVSVKDAGSSASLNGSAITTTGERGYGLLAQSGGLITTSGVNITTSGRAAHAVQAGGNGTNKDAYPTGSAGTINLTGGTISTSNWYSTGLHAVDAGSITADGVTVQNAGEAGHGAHAESESSISIKNGVINVSGLNAHGILANNDQNKYPGFEDARGGYAELVNTSITTTSGYGLDVSAGATVQATGGSITTSGALAYGVSVKDAGSSASLNGSAISTTGANAHAASIENGASLTMVGGSLNASGAGAAGLNIVNGSSATVNSGSLFSASGSAIALTNSGNVSVVGASLGTGGSPIIAASFNQADQNIGITLGAGVTTTNNGQNLLTVTREAGANGTGAVTLRLEDDAIAYGDIVDAGEKTTGYTDVFVGADAKWTGITIGVRNFRTDGTGAQIDFTDGASIGGNLELDSADVTFGNNVQIAGSVTFTGNTSTRGGVDAPIVVTGNVFSGNGVNFGGNWNIGGNLASYGFFNPGNSIGFVSVGGDVTFGSSSTYVAEINGAGQADLVSAGGVAYLGGKVIASPYPAGGSFLIGNPYKIVTAAGGFAGTSFDGGIEWQGPSFIFLDPQLRYDANNVYFVLDRGAVTMASVALTPNEAAVAGALDRLPVTGRLAQALLTQQSVAGAREAFNALSGEIYPSIAGTMVEDSQKVRSAINNRLIQAFEGDAVNPASATVRRLSSINGSVWGQAMGSWGHSDSRNVAKADRNSAGFMAGIDAAVADNWRMGVAAGYSRSTVDVDQRLSSASYDSYHVALYGGSRFGNFGLRMGGAYTWNDVNANRTVTFPGFAEATSSSYRANVAQLFAEGSYKLQFGATTVEPFANLAWVGLDTNSMFELGRDAALYGKIGNMNSTFTTLGARFAHTFRINDAYALTARGTIGWRHAFGDVDPRAVMFISNGASAFTVAGAPIARNSLLLEAGLDMDIARNVTLGISWTGQIADHVQDHAIKGNFTARF